MFKGFEAPNFTQVPNDYLEYTFSDKCDLTALEMRIMNFFFRETYGWQDKKAQLVASVTDFQAMLNIQKRKSITDALDRLASEKRFLQSVQVKQLSKRSRDNIQKMVNKTLHPAQKLYRLNLKDNPNGSWDNIRNWQTTEMKERKQEFLIIKKEKKNNSDNSNGYQEVPINGYQEVPINGYQEVPINGYQEVPIVESETIGRVSVNEPLNKGLNKDLNKSLNKNTYLSDISESKLPSNIKNVLTDRIGRLVSDSIKLIDIENHFFSHIDKSVDQYEYADVLTYYLDNTKDKITRISSLLNIGIKKHIEFRSELKSNKKINKPLRTEKIPGWFEDSKNYYATENDSAENAKNGSIEEKKRKLEETLASLRKSNQEG